MNLRKFFYPNPGTGNRTSLALLAVRVAFGLGMAAHGFDKIKNPLGWMGPDAPMPGFLQLLAAVSEFFGGLALAAGLLTPLAALGVMATMFVAAFVALGNAPLIANGAGPSKEPALSYFVVALALFVAGPGKLSLDHLLFGRGRDAETTTEPSAAKHAAAA